MTETEISNLAGARLGGFGDQQAGNGTIEDIDGTDRNSVWCKILLPVCRRNVITDFAVMDCPFRETIKYLDLGAALTVDSLPEIGTYGYAFNIPNDCLSMIAQISEDSLCLPSSVSMQREYQYEIIANKGGNGKVLLTSDLTNTDLTSAFIKYSIDITNPAGFSPALLDCLIVLLAAELAPLCGKDSKTRMALLTEYETLAKPKAKRFNQSQYNNRATSPRPNYLGGRSEISGV